MNGAATQREGLPSHFTDHLIWSRLNSWDYCDDEATWRGALNWHGTPAEPPALLYYNYY